MTTEDMIVTLIAAVVSGVLATIISLYINHRNDIMKQKKALAADIFGYRFLINKQTDKDKFYAALNRVPIVFADDKKVIEAYDTLLECSMICDSVSRTTKMNEALITFLKTLCKATKINCDNWNDSKVMKVFGA